MAISRSWSITIGMSCLFVVLLGCGSSGPPRHLVKGKISDAGKVVSAKENESKSGGKLRVWLVSQEAGKSTDIFEAFFPSDDGSFTIGSDGKGIPAGKYKVCVELRDPFPMGKDKFEGKFSEGKSKIIRDVPPPDGQLTIDVSKSEG